MRYAEVLLNYVEALNELGSNTYTDEENGITVSRDVDEMVKYFIWFAIEPVCRALQRMMQGM